MAIVYQATNLVNGKRYIGVTSKTLERRRYGHHYDARKGRNKVFSKAIRKYGEAAFEWKILHDYLFSEDAMQAEARFVEMLKPEYNMTLGGEGVRGLKMSAESRAKMSAAQTPERRAKSSERAKISFSPEVRARSVASLRARKGMPNLKARGKKRTQQLKDISRQTGLKYKDEFMRRMANIPRWNSRIVVCLDDGVEFPSASAAARHYGVGKSSIIETCLGRDNRLTVGGRMFQYKDAPVVHRASKKCKLDRKKVAEIRALFGTLSQGRIAKLYGVNRVTITDIAVGRSWKEK